MKLDVALPHGTDPAVLEAVGFDGAWVSEIAHDPFVTLASVAAGTATIELGTSVAIAFARNPMTVAVQANDLHLLTGGRFLLGLGSQVKAHITRRYGMPWSHPADRMREFVQAVRAIWAAWAGTAPLDFRGEFYKHTLMTPFFDPGPNPHGPPPVYVAAVGERMTRVAGEVADGVVCHGFTTTRYLREVTLPAFESGRTAAERNDRPGVCVTPMIACGRSAEELDTAVAATRKQIAFYASTPSYRAVMDRHGWGETADKLQALARRGAWDAMTDAIDDEMMCTVAVVGDPATVGAGLHERFAGLATRVVLYPPYDPPEGMLGEVAAAFKSGQTHRSGTNGS